MKEFKTKQRELILNLLQKASTPLSASDIQQHLANEINASTVYRNLEKYHVQGIIAKTHIFKKDYYYLADNHQHIAVCQQCQTMQNIPCHLDDSIIDDKLNELNFTVASHDLIIYGLCCKCKTEDK